MMRLTGVLIGSILISVIVAACSSDDAGGGKKATGGTGGTGATDGAAGSGGGTGGATGGAAGSGATGGIAGSGGAAGSAGADGGLAARGEYIVRHIAACGDCHTPRKSDGSLDESKWLSGVEGFADVDPTDATKGQINSRNLTSDATTGLGNWTDDQIKNAFLNGVDDKNKPLFPIMPYFVFHNMSASDADAIVAYLRTVPAVSHNVPDNQPLPFPFTQPAQPVPASSLPDTTLPSTDPNYASAVRGKYLAANIGVCMECHTKHTTGTPIPLDTTKLFAGGEDFTAAQLGLPAPPWPTDIYSANITPDTQGIQGWTPQDVVKVLKQGIMKEGSPLCPPMPAGPTQAFGGMTDQDALDIGNYITTLAPIANGSIPMCMPPSADGGMGDGSMGDGSMGDASMD